MLKKDGRYARRLRECSLLIKIEIVLIVIVGMVGLSGKSNEKGKVESKSKDTSQVNVTSEFNDASEGNVANAADDTDKVNEDSAASESQDGNISEDICDASKQTILYFSESGNDANDGLTEAHPKRNFTKYSSVDNVILKFRCGDTFVFDSDLQAFLIGENVEITSYGEGTQPIITGYIEVKGSVYYSGENCYWISLKDYGQYETGKNQDKNIGSIRIYDTEQKTSTISFQRCYTKSLLKQDGDFYIDYQTDRCYIYSESNPSRYEYSFARTGACFALQESNPKVWIHDITVTGFSKHGICGTYRDVTIENCHVYDIGGEQIHPEDVEEEGWERMGNGIEVWGDGSENVLIQNNIVESCFDAGITVQAAATCTKGAKHIEFAENYVSNCYYLIELFNHNSKNEFSEIELHDNLLLNCNSIGYRQYYYSYSQLCVWSQEYPKDEIEVYDNLFAYTNQYTCFAYIQAEEINCNIHDNVFATNRQDTDEYGLDLIKENNTIYDLSQSSVKDSVRLLIAVKMKEIGVQG